MVSGASDVVVVFATLAGPVLAVQAQKWVERWRERVNRKRWIIYTLMATRGARLSQEHVRALNSIELTYYGAPTWFKKKWQREKERTVITRWNSYLDHLNTTQPTDPTALTAWVDTATDLFCDLLDALLAEQRFDFNLMQIKRGHYNPAAHYTTELEGAAVRRLSVEWLLGTRAVNVNVAVPQQAPVPPPPAAPATAPA